jgi:protein SCO1/2
MTNTSAGTKRQGLRAATAVLGALLVAASPGKAEKPRTPAKGGCEHCHEVDEPGARPKGKTRVVEKGAARGEATAAGYVRSERTYAVPDVTLVDDGSRPVRLREALAGDEPVMVNFIFTTCTAICPVMTGIFARVPKELGSEAGRLRLISISIDPEQDTPGRLRAYAERFGAGPRWRFLTGSVRDIEAVERAFDAYRGDKMNHEPLTLLRAGPDRPWVRLDGFASPAELARESEKVALR